MGKRKKSLETGRVGLFTYGKGKGRLPLPTNLTIWKVGESILEGMKRGKGTKGKGKTSSEIV